MKTVFGCAARHTTQISVVRLKLFGFALAVSVFVICLSRTDLVRVHKMFQTPEDVTRLPDVRSSPLSPEITGRALESMYRPRDATQVLVLTYMRSGSSLTGDILQHAPGAFYSFEPFRSLGQKNSSTFNITYANGSTGLPPFDFAEEAARELYDWFTCDVTSLPIITLKDEFMNIGLKSRIFRQCLLETRRTSLNESYAMLMCAKQLQVVCENSPFRVVKTIRLELSSVRHLLGVLPNLKIVHLVRDPRATLFSQAVFGMCSEKRGGALGCTNKFCKRVENDVLEEERIMSELPARILPVFYENIAREPIETAKKMFDFIGADFTKEAEEYIFNITMAGHENNCLICTTRSNSTEHINTWKKAMKPEFIKIVQERCNYVLKRYNYEILPFLT